MNCMKTPDLLAALRWRYAVKAFDPAKKIPEATWRDLEEALILTPSSFGMQPWKFIVVTDPAVREKLRAASWNQGQVTECSHHVVFAGATDVSEADVTRYMESMAAIRSTPVSAFDGLKKMIVGFAGGLRAKGQVHEWAVRQVYIALGNFMTSAAVVGVDTCPMEGIDPAKYDEILGLAGSGYKTVVACAAGYRASGDQYASLAKVRYPASELIRHV